MKDLKGLIRVVWQNLKIRLQRIWVEIHITRMMFKIRRARKHIAEENRRLIEAKGQVVLQMDGLLNEILHKTLRDYHENFPQNFHTVQAQKDIKATYLEVMQRYIRAA